MVFKISKFFVYFKTLKNFAKLKTRKNNRQTPKEKFDEQEVKKLEDDVQKTEAMQKFNEVVRQFSSPSLEIIFPNNDQFQTYTYNENKDCFIFGYSNGEVILSFLISIKRFLLKIFNYGNLKF